MTRSEGLAERRLCATNGRSETVAWVSSKVKTGFEAIVFGSLRSDAEGGTAEELSCLFLSAKTGNSLGIRGCSSARKDPRAEARLVYSSSPRPSRASDGAAGRPRRTTG